jgi:hypothetical protein
MLEHIARQRHPDLVKPEIGRGGENDRPALVGCRGCRQVLFERLKQDLIVDLAAEGSFDEHAASDSKLHVAEMLHAYPSDYTKSDDHKARELLVHGQERSGGAQSTAGVEHERGFARAEAVIEQAVVDVSPIGREDRLMPQEAPDDRERGVDQGNRERHQGRRHSQDRGGLLAPEDPIATEHEADEQTA